MVTRKFVYALTVRERINAFKEQNKIIGEDPTILEEKWFNVNSLVTRELFNKKLEVSEIQIEEFSFAIKTFSEYEEKLLEPFLIKQEWFKNYITVIELYKLHGSPRKINNTYLVDPFTVYIKTQLECLKFNSVHISKETLEKGIERITMQLSKFTWKCIVVEMEKYKEKHKLNGNNPNEKYLDFMERKYGAIDKIEKFYEKYPVLARIVVQKMKDLLNAYIEIIINIDKNYTLIDTQLNIGSNVISQIDASQGDTHNNGRSVAIITFENGKKIVYKPRNAEIVKSYNKFMAYINKELPTNALYINPLFSSKNFSVEKYVSYIPCDNESEIADYYYRFGKLIAIISYLNGTDFHCENIIAHKYYPVIVDHETLFSQIGEKSYEDKYVMNLKDREFLDPMMTALLPIVALNNNLEQRGIDVGGISGGEEAEYPSKVLVAKEVFTDNMHFINEFVKKPENQNIPKLHNNRISYEKYKGKVYEGFNEVIDFLAINKERINHLINQLFGNIKVRQVMKATAIYADLLKYCDHPNYLSNMINLERLLDNSYAYPHENKKIVLYEIESLINLEIPIFYTITTMKALFISDNKYIGEYYKLSGLERILEKAKSINDESVKREKTKLKILLGDFNVIRTMELPKYEKSELEYELNSEIPKLCFDLKEKVVHNVLYNNSGNIASWRNIEFAKVNPEIGYMQEGIYNGKTGINIFFDAITQNTLDCISLLEHTLFDSNSPKKIESSVYRGRASQIYFALIKKDYNDLAIFLQELKEYLTNTEELVFDWLGAASYAKLLYKLSKLDIENDRVFKISEILIDKLVKYIYSELKIESIGFGHGEIGIIYSIYLIEEILGKRYKNEINYLCRKLNEKVNNLEQYRTINMSWCHGLAGLGLGALECLKFEKREEYGEYLKKAMQQLHITQEQNINMCLCHGTCGEIELLLAAGAKIGGNNPISGLLRNRVEEIITYYKKNRLLLVDQVPEFENYGFYTGESGVAYTLLRVLYGSRLPNILLLD